MEHQELAAWLRLLLTPGIGNSHGRKLLAAFGLPESVFEQPLAELTRVVGPALALALLDAPPELTVLLDTTRDWLDAESQMRRILTLGDPLYPQSLLQTEDPPLLLYAMGRSQVWECNLLNDSAHACLAVVGSRNPSPQGTVNARNFSQTLAEAGLTIVSGLALGVDGAAHEGALAGAPAEGLATIAVVGTGLDRVYPRQHRELAQRIAQRGVLLSEFALGTAPVSANFPRRNRIISGLSRGTLVVEAALQSGSLITAGMAIEQGREVFAIPGSIHAPQSRGCHALIKQGAKLVERAQDVLEELQWAGATKAPSGTQVPLALQPDVDPDGEAESPPESALIEALGYNPTGLDALQARTGLPTAHLLAQLMALQLQGQVARLPGGLYQRLSQG
ncbi:DNA-protecting protein DprA [Rhodoferax lacus]|uniref:DNA-protecting protein DprA n=1 Tax=Rhodoferax lacus TaxID=2184758 RepID=A0A3E1RB40_9BURK|nr:DNA-processing protein DprA [Rhodoferax lacus]RFO96576.1 DNA-protecting protein DprA [Rhodoferax lacus]